jgi:hypothetical protein
VHHNFWEWKAQIVKLKKKCCACIGGYDIRNGEQRGEDFSAQATLAERRRVWKELAKLEAARVKEDAQEGSDWKLNKRKYMDLKYKLKNDTIKHWQSIKHALKTSAAVQLGPAAERVRKRRSGCAKRVRKSRVTRPSKAVHTARYRAWTRSAPCVSCLARCGAMVEGSG